MPSDLEETTRTFRNITRRMLEDIPLTNHAFYTIAFIETAYQFDGRSEADAMRMFQAMYEDDLELLNGETLRGPLVLERLEQLSREAPEESIAKSMALKYLPSVRNFVQLSKRYASSIQNEH